MNKVEPCSFEQMISKGLLTQKLLGLSPKGFKIRTSGRPEEQLQLIAEKAFEHFNAGRLFLFDANLGNNQCHITALMVAKLFNKYKAMGEKITFKNVDLEEARFLVLSFMTANAFNHSMDPLTRALEVDKNKRLRGRIKSFVGQVKKNARSKLIGIVRDRIFKMIENFSDASLKPELNALAERTLREGSSFEFPKFASVILFLDEAKREAVPLIFRVKVICTHGFHTKTFAALHPEKPLVPIEDEDMIEGGAVVFEGMGTLIDMFFSQYRAVRDECHQAFFFEKPAKKEASHRCGACMPCENEACGIEAHSDRILELGSNVEGMLLGSAADFTHSLQDFSVKEDGALNALFKKAFLSSKRCETSSLSRRPVFAIEHAFADSPMCIGVKRLLDAPPETLVERRLKDAKA